MRRLAALIVSLVVLGPAASGALASARGDVSVLALIPTPGYPALPHEVGPNIYEGTYDNPGGDSVPSRVLEYDANGALTRSWTVTGQDLSKPHGVQVAANDGRGRLLLLDKTSGRIIRLDPSSGSQTFYSRIPDLPACGSAPAGAECSPATRDLTPMPDYAAWGPDGSLYVTDYQQAAIFRVPPAGGTARVWLADPRLDGGPFGTACVTMLPDHHTLLFDQASNGGLGTLTPTTGKLYTVSIDAAGRPGPLTQLWESGSADAPDGCAVARSGNIYIALVGASNQVVEVNRSGQEIARFGQQYSGTNNSSVPFDSPSGVAFRGTQLLIANQSYFAGSKSNQAILALETGEQGQPVYVPAYAGEKPPAVQKKHKRHKPHKHKTHRHRRPAVKGR